MALDTGIRAVKIIATQRALLLSAFAACLFMSNWADAAISDAGLQATVRAATFEVVVEKPTQDSLSYERALPLDLLPYNVRMDKYFSIGTAFAIGKNTYVTAAHVLRIGQRSQFGAPALRATDGRVFLIDNILKYSLAEDFVVFSLQQPPNASPLKTEINTKIDSKVFAVGNALGEGIIIRDGVYTSDTPENRDGRWKWVRFSAAASPGNSGGPLLNDQGKVIAVISMKSPSENLNYALPIARVLDAKNNLAVIDARSTYSLGIFDATETQTLKYEVPLSLSMARLADVINENQSKFSAQILQALLNKERANTFPNGAGSNQLLYAPHNVTFPSLITRNSNGQWDARVPERIANIPLSQDAHAYFAVQQQMMLLRLQRPSDIAADKFYSDSKVFGDLFLKAAPFTRTVGPEKIRITSMGAAREDSEYVDSYRRKWRLRVWNLEFQDTAVVALLLPSPEGYVAILRPTPTSSISDVVNDFKAMADFLYMPYMGTFQQWQDFLELPKLLPDVFSKLKINIDYDHVFDYRSPRFSLTYAPPLQKITKDSTLSLAFAYFKDGEQIVWDVYGLIAYENKNATTSVAIYRVVKPVAEVDDQTKDGWRRVIRKEHPYDAAPFTEGDRTVIREVIGNPITVGSAVAEPALRYTAGYMAEGKPSDASMKEKLNLLNKGLQIQEKQ